MARTIGYSPARKPIPAKPTMKKCTTLECQLSDLRSQTSVWNIGEQVNDLLSQIQKKKMML